MLITVGSRVPVTEALASQITKKSHSSEILPPAVVHSGPSLASNGPRRVLISEGPKLNLASGASERVRPSGTCGPRRVPMAVPSVAIARPVQSSSGLRQPAKHEISGLKPVQRAVGSRLPVTTRRIGIGSGPSGVEYKGTRRVT